MDGDFNIGQTDVIEAVRQSALLADITLGMWNAERSDRQLMEEVKTNAGARGNVGRVVKNLLAGADGKLKDVRSAFSACRTIHYQFTLPWVSNPHAERQSGARLLPHALFQKYLGEMSKQKRKALALLDEFLAEYPELVTSAKANLGDMAADADYPTADQVRASFRVEFEFAPIPEGKAFKGLPPEWVERLSHGLQARHQRMVDGALKAAWDEARERIQHFRDKLADPESRFKSSTVESVRDLVTMLPGWNMCDDERMQDIASDIAAVLHGRTAESLRKDAGERVIVADHAQKLLDKLSQWGV